MIVWNRASQAEWSNSCLTSIAIKTVHKNEPLYLYQSLIKAFYTLSIGNFYDNSKGKIGRQKLNYKLTFMDQMDFHWLHKPLTDEILLNETIFSYK